MPQGKPIMNLSTETVAKAVETAVDSKLVAAPPIFISATSFLGVPWQQWAYITASLYSVLMIVGWFWKALRRRK